MKPFRPSALALFCLFSVPLSHAWGSKGHRIINRLAAQALPADIPAFLRAPDAINEIDYLGPEPDRWRSRAEPELNAAQAPDHFIDLEYADLIGTLPRERYEYIAALYAYAAAHPDRAAVLRPEKVGFQPYITSEVWERLKSAMRDYRTLSAQHQDTKPVEAAILFYAGWLGHYVGDGSQPLHVTIQYNSWVGPNPNGYTTEHHIHSLFETTFVNAAINASDVQPLLASPRPIGDEWTDYLAYLRRTGTYIEKVYQLDKAHGFDGSGTEESRQFTAERLAAGASMLRDMIVAAWEKSAEPVPEWHEEHALASPGAAANVSPDQVFRKPFPAGFRNPILNYAPDPQFSDKARKHKYSGRIIVGLTVDKNGNATDVHIVSGENKELQQGALDAVRQYKFSPATYKGEPVAAQIDVEVNFRTYE
ncbi:MAG TPA: S1/P1 nuclease [Acidobacteriaceae bacterium]|nr:S1/P1 nuclease [Acidobacteriaceae bacterium]